MLVIDERLELLERAALLSRFFNALVDGVNIPSEKISLDGGCATYSLGFDFQDCDFDMLFAECCIGPARRILDEANAVGIRSSVVQKLGVWFLKAVMSGRLEGELSPVGKRAVNEPLSLPHLK